MCAESWFFRTYILLDNLQAVFNELCNILNPGKLAFVPKKGKSNVIMFFGLQGELRLGRVVNFRLMLPFAEEEVETEEFQFTPCLTRPVFDSEVGIDPPSLDFQALGRLQHVQNTHTTIKRRDGSPPWYALIHFELVHLISSSRMQPKPKYHFMAGDVYS